jgi:hypothetical protein
VDVIAQEFATILQSESSYRDPHGFGIVFEMGLSAISIADYISHSVFLVTSQAADFHRRIQLEMVQKFPLQLAWFTYQPCDVRCGFRQVLCNMSGVQGLTNKVGLLVNGRMNGVVLVGRAVSIDGCGRFDRGCHGQHHSIHSEVEIARPGRRTPCY